MSDYWKRRAILAWSFSTITLAFANSASDGHIVTKSPLTLSSVVLIGFAISIQRNP